MQTEMRELDTLLDYIIKHNKEHAEEIKNLAQKAKDLGKVAVYDDLTKGVEQMNRSNESLKSALNKLRRKSKPK